MTASRHLAPPPCDGTGTVACGVCGGGGMVPVDDDDQRSELRRKYSAKERQALAKQHKALPDGSFPVRDREDLKNAVAAFGRAKDPAKVKAHIIARARALNAVDLLPASWQVKRSATVTIPHRYTAGYLTELEVGLLLPSSKLTRQARGASPRDRAERDWLRHRFSAPGCPE